MKCSYTPKIGNIIFKASLANHINGSNAIFQWVGFEPTAFLQKSQRVCFQHRSQVTKIAREDDTQRTFKLRATNTSDKICDVQFAFLLFAFQIIFLCAGARFPSVAAKYVIRGFSRSKNIFIRIFFFTGKKKNLTTS